MTMINLSFPTREHRGYKMVQYGQSITVYGPNDNRLALWEEPVYHDGKSGWKACREWIDKQLNK